MEVGINVGGGAQVTNQGVTPGKIVLSACATVDYSQHMALKARTQFTWMPKAVRPTPKQFANDAKQFANNAKTVHQQRQSNLPLM